MSYWACARTEPRREAVAKRFLEQAGFEVFIPLFREHRIKGSRRFAVVTPLFPAYAFVGITNGWHQARWTIGVSALIMNGDRPAVVQDGIIDELRGRAIRGAIELPRRDGLKAGDRVRVLAGPLQGQLVVATASECILLAPSSLAIVEFASTARIAEALIARFTRRRTIPLSPVGARRAGDGRPPGSLPRATLPVLAYRPAR
jgi:transcriptional antiterminator RfaH